MPWFADDVYALSAVACVYCGAFPTDHTEEQFKEHERLAIEAVPRMLAGTMDLYYSDNLEYVRTSIREWFESTAREAFFGAYRKASFSL